jgi:uncharacterized protein YdhG (YjbR/CyaY superfamily)
MDKTTSKDVTAYFDTQPAPVNELLQQIRETIKQAAPEADEVISYQMPAFRQHGILVYYAGWNNHIGFYPASSGGSASLQKEMEKYKVSKGTLHFPSNQPIPLKLITKIVKMRLKENTEKAKLKTATRKSVTKTKK